MREIERLVKKFFDGVWEPLESNMKKLPTMPGVYALAFTDEDLSGQRLNCGQIVYVGMSRAKAGLRGRLIQFMKGVTKGEGHSAGNRFYREREVRLKLANGRPVQKCRFWVSYLELECEAQKGLRDAQDLRIIGHVECLEKYLMAQVYTETGAEPRLNFQ